MSILLSSPQSPCFSSGTPCSSVLSTREKGESSSGGSFAGVSASDANACSKDLLALGLRKAGFGDGCSPVSCCSCSRSERVRLLVRLKDGDERSGVLAGLSDIQEC